LNQPPVRITLEEAILSIFSHEGNHNTDTEFIQNLRAKREDRPFNADIEPHTNIHPRETDVWNELGRCNGLN